MDSHSGVSVEREAFAHQPYREGYGWLPYEYILRGLAEDFWSVLKKEWIDTGQFRE
jgi:hypothetical protein